MVKNLLIYIVALVCISTAASASTVRVSASYTDAFGFHAGFVAEDLNGDGLIEYQEIEHYYYYKHSIASILQDSFDYGQSGSTIQNVSVNVNYPIELFQPNFSEYQVGYLATYCNYRCLEYDGFFVAERAGKPISWSVMPVPAGAPLLLSAFALFGGWRVRAARRRR